jgi:hypothetical protein
MTTSSKPIEGDSSSLLAIARAANRSGDLRLERAARQELLERHGIILRFTRKPKGDRQQ